MGIITWTQGTTHTPLAQTLLDPTGAIINLAGLTGSSIVAMVRTNIPVSSSHALAGATTIVSASAGTITYAFAASDVATPGNYILEFLVTFGDSTTVTTPPSYFYITPV